MPQLGNLITSAFGASLVFGAGTMLAVIAAIRIKTGEFYGLKICLTLLLIGFALGFGLMVSGFYGPSGIYYFQLVAGMIIMVTGGFTSASLTLHLAVCKLRDKEFRIQPIDLWRAAILAFTGLYIFSRGYLIFPR